MIDAKREVRALGACFYFHEGNSDVQKVALYVALALWALGCAGILAGLVSLDTGDKVAVWSTLTGLVTYLFGRVHGKEVAIDARRK